MEWLGGSSSVPIADLIISICDSIDISITQSISLSFRVDSPKVRGRVDSAEKSDSIFCVRFRPRSIREDSKTRTLSAVETFSIPTTIDKLIPPDRSVDQSVIVPSSIDRLPHLDQSVVILSDAPNYPARIFSIGYHRQSVE